MVLRVRIFRAFITLFLFRRYRLTFDMDEAEQPLTLFSEVRFCITFPAISACCEHVVYSNSFHNAQ